VDYDLQWHIYTISVTVTATAARQFTRIASDPPSRCVCGPPEEYMDPACGMRPAVCIRP
jgi:hypothetical protein